MSRSMTVRESNQGSSPARPRSGSRSGYRFARSAQHAFNVRIQPEGIPSSAAACHAMPPLWLSGSIATSKIRCPSGLCSSHARMSMAISWRIPRSFCRLKSVAPADRSHLQVERRMLRMPAVVQERLRGFMLLADLRQLRRRGMVFAEMGAKPALAVLYVGHVEGPPGRNSVQVLCQPTGP